MWMDCESSIARFVTRSCCRVLCATRLELSGIAMLLSFIGRGIAQAVSRRLPTAAARVRAHVRSRGGQSGTEVGFVLVLQFPLPILIPPTAPHLSSIIRGWYNRPVSGRRTKWTQSHPPPEET
jgi:hypothetical protein